MKQKITVLLLVVGVSLLLTVLAVQLAPDLLDNTGGIVAVFAAIFLAIMGLGGGTINDWVKTLFGEKKKKTEADTIVEKGGIYVGPGGKVEQRFGTPVETKLEDDVREETEEPSLSREEARTAYLSALIDDFRSLSLPGMDVRSGDVIQAKLRLEDIYISLDTTAQEQKKTGKKRAETESELMAQLGRESKPLTVLDALLQAPDRRMVLKGMPGTGKSTFVKYLSLRLARQLLDPSEKPLENWDGKPLLPLAISLGRFAEILDDDLKKGSAEMVEKFLMSSLEGDKRMRHFAPHVLRVLEEEGGLILFDGLDEVAKMHLRPVVVQAIESFADKYARRSQSRFLVTCRVLSYENMSRKLAGWTEYEIALFSQGQIREFIERWYTLHAAQEIGRAVEYNRKKPELMAAVQVGEPRRLHEVARYPIVLTMIAIVHASYELPDNRAEVYEQCVELLLNKWQYTRSIGGIKETRTLAAELNLPAGSIYEPLYEIAFKAHAGHQGGRDRAEDSGSLITEGSIVGILHDHWQDRKKVDTFIEYCQRSNGLLMWRGTVELAGSNVRRNEYTFPHLTFEEFLASRYMQSMEPEEVRRLLDDAHDRWREPIKFLGESYCFNKVTRRSLMDGLLQALCRPFSDPTLSDWRALWLAGELLTYYKRAWPKKKSPYEDEIVENLRRLVFESPLSPRERADAADIVDQLSPLSDLYTFIPLSGFAVSKYPVTNAQYDRFLEPENFRNKSLWVNLPKYDESSQPMNETWGEEAWNWLQKELQDKDNDIQDEVVLLPRYWRDPRFGMNRRHAPVVGISWYEANAYCNWLLMNWDELEEGKQGLPKPEWVRLPLDTEWTLAAGGEEEQRFAFGVLKNPNEEIIAHANTSESKIGRTAPVWMYSQKGASPTGVLDMSGNVWEWLANYRDVKSGWLGLRGGSWNYDGSVARVSLRGYFRPSNWSYRLGFRVVVSLPNG